MLRSFQFSFVSTALVIAWQCCFTARGELVNTFLKSYYDVKLKNRLMCEYECSHCCCPLVFQGSLRYECCWCPAEYAAIVIGSVSAILVLIGALIAVCCLVPGCYYHRKYYPDHSLYTKRKKRKQEKKNLKQAKIRSSLYKPVLTEDKDTMVV